MNKNFDKPPWRDRSLEFMKGSHLFKLNKFTHSIVTLCGSSGHEFYKVCKPYLTDVTQFISVDNDLSVIFEHRKRFDLLSTADKSWAFNPVYSDIGDLVGRLMHATQPPYPAIYDFDMTMNVGSVPWWNSTRPLFRTIIQQTLSASWAAPEVIFILNHSLDCPKDKEKPSVRLARHVDEAMKTFGNYGLTRKRILGPDYKSTFAKADERSFLGWLGAFDVYKSTNHVLRMATLRISIDKNGIKKIDHEVY